RAMAFSFSWSTRPWSSKAAPRMGDTTKSWTVVEDEITTNLQLDALEDTTNAFSAGIYPVVNVRDKRYSNGAAGDGATDDTAAILAAQTAALNEGLPLFFPP